MAGTPSDAPLPGYLAISAEDLGKGQPVKVRRTADAASMARDLAEMMVNEIRKGGENGNGATLIVPVGPVDHYPILAAMVNEQKVSCRNAVFINMDEYLTNDDHWISDAHPLSFRGYMERAFYGLLDPDLAPPPSHRVFPDPKNPGQIQELITARNGVDACFGGLGINGHIAFNEPIEPGDDMTVEKFGVLPTRVLDLSRETRTINSVTVGGELAVIPSRAVTIGMREILAARRLRFYCNRPWQSGVVRRVLHGPLTPACPGSYLRTHSDAEITVVESVTRPPDIRLR